VVGKVLVVAADDGALDGGADADHENVCVGARDKREGHQEQETNLGGLPVRY